MQVILLDNVYSLLKGRQLYGLKGDKVRILSDHHGVLIVEGPYRIEEEINRKTFLKVSGTHRYPVQQSIVQIKTT